MSGNILYEQELIRLANEHRLPHAIIIEDENSFAAEKSALKLAQTLLCTADVKPCGNCSNCVKCLRGSHTDVQFISPQNSSSIKVDDIRLMRSDAYVVSNEGGCKIYIISQADCMTVQSQNAFIKILEEPPKNVFFIILCQSQMSLLNTVRSRCCIYRSAKTQIDNENTINDLAKKIVESSLGGNQFEVMKNLAQMDSNRLEFKELIDKVCENFVLEVSKGTKVNDVACVIKKIDDLKYIFNQVDKNVNLNLLKCYFSAVL